MNLKEQFGRIVKIAQLIKKEPGEWDVPGLAVELGVSESTIGRDIHVLKSYGEVRKLRGKGYVIQHFELPLEHLSIEEVLAMTIGGQMVSKHLGSPYSNIISSALRKIGALLPPHLEGDITRLDAHLSIGSPLTRDYSRHGRIFQALNRAILRHHPVQITYYTIGRQALSERKVDPYCITFRRGAWYLIAYCHLRKEVRTFGIHRIRKAVVQTREHFRFPEEFSAEKYLEGSWQLIVEGPPMHVAVRFNREVARWIQEGRWHPTQRLTPSPDGSILFEAEVAGILEIKRWILSYGGAAEVLEPAELREAVLKEVRGLAQTYLAPGN